MRSKINKVLFWAPRILSIFFALFLSLFALDVFDEGYGFGALLIALLIHLIPTFLIVISLAIAWRREKLGAILFFSVALFYLVISQGRGWIVSAPLLFIGALFLLNSLNRPKLK